MAQQTRRERQALGIRVAKTKGKYKGGKPGYRKAKPAKAQKLRDKGLTVKDIAATMKVSEMTVFRYLRAEKAGAKS